MADAFEQLAQPGLVLDERGLVVRCNSEAERIISPLSSVHHREIAFHDQDNQRSFHSALAQAGFEAEWNGSTRSPTVLRHPSGQVWRVKATALGDWARYTFVQASYLVILEEVRDQTSISGFWEKRYALTPAEIRLAELLVTGLSLKMIADRQAITYETVRNQLKSVLAKTEVHRQAELVSLLLRTRG